MPKTTKLILLDSLLQESREPGCTAMRYVAAAMLVSMAGNELTRANIQRILESVGVECEDDKLQIVLDQLKGKDVNELIAAGLEKLGNVPAVGSGAAGIVPEAAAAQAAPLPEEKKEEKKEEAEDSDEDMGFGLFD